VQQGKTTTQTTFFDLTAVQRHQLYRAYYELVTYIPREKTPDETFLPLDVQRCWKTEIDMRRSTAGTAFLDWKNFVRFTSNSLQKAKLLHQKVPVDNQ